MAIGEGQDVTERKITLPERWQTLLDGQTGPVTFSRRFNRPTGLADTDRVILLLPRCLGQKQQMVLNDAEIAADSPSDDETRYDVTQHLDISNTLAVCFTLPENGSFSGDDMFEGVVIEIQSAD